MMDLFRLSGVVCMGLQIVGCGPATSSEDGGTSDHVALESPDRVTPASPTDTSLPQSQNAEPIFVQITDGEALRRAFTDRQLRLRPGQSTPVVAERFGADDCWSATVEAVILTSLTGTWEVAEEQDAEPRICVTMLTRNGNPLTDTREICRDVMVSENGSVVNLPSLYSHDLMAAYDVTPLGATP